ncbi:MAG: hypothetical protein JWP85_726 [Rhodoglobus sp.]|nr:hypothetical protein [Rhodoglobus sp.]
MTTTAITETYARRVASQHGLALRKSRARNPLAIEYGTYGLVEPATNSWVLTMPYGYGYTLDEVRDFLAQRHYAFLSEREPEAEPETIIGVLQPPTKD